MICQASRYHLDPLARTRKLVKEIVQVCRYFLSPQRRGDDYVVCLGTFTKPKSIDHPRVIIPFNFKFKAIVDIELHRLGKPDDRVERRAAIQ